MLAFFSCLDKSINEMDGKKVYQIEINGVKESVAAVESLNKELNELENRIKALEKSNVKVGTSSSSGGGSKSSLNEEEKLAKQIEQIDAKREAYSKEIYCCKRCIGCNCERPKADFSTREVASKQLYQHNGWFEART